MSPFTELYSECISFLAMYTLPSCSLSWGDIALLVLPKFAASKIAYSTTIFGRSSLCSTFFIAAHPHIMQPAPYIIPTLCLKMTHT